MATRKTQIGRRSRCVLGLSIYKQLIDERVCTYCAISINATVAFAFLALFESRSRQYFQRLKYEARGLGGGYPVASVSAIAGL